MSEDIVDEELVMAEHIATLFLVAAVTIVVVGVAVAWNAISLTASAVQTVRRRHGNPGQ